jgi:DNA polymerase
MMIDANALHFDIETFSECDLKECGVYKYAEHPSTEMLCMTYRFGDGPVTLWIPDLTAEALRPQLVERLTAKFGDGAKDITILIQCETPDDIYEHIIPDETTDMGRGQTRAHNHQFERVVMNGSAGRKLGFPRIEIEQTVCTAAKAASHGIPRALGDACKATGAYPKDDLGKIDMLMISKPRRHKTEPRWTPTNAPDKFLNVYVYNVDDVLAESSLDTKIPELDADEQDIYELDQYINERGVLVDLPRVADAQFLVDEYKQQLEAQCIKMTCNGWDDEDQGIKPTQHEKIANWIRENGWPNLADLQAETVKQLVQRDDVPDNIKTMLKLYSTYGMKAVSKFETLPAMACADSALHGLFLYHAANTGRWSSLGVQLHNMFRGALDEHDDPAVAIEAFEQRSLDLIRMMYPGLDPMKVLASCVRGMLISRPGYDLIANDFAGIESRVNAWLFDEQWKLDAFTAYDEGTGPDLYKVAYARAFQILIDRVTKKQRQLGKVMELALGYEGGVGAFVTMVAAYGIDLDDMAAQVLPILPEDVVESAEWLWKKQGQKLGVSHDVFIACDGLKQLWRAAHPGIVQGWKDLREAAEQAVQHPGTAFKIPNGKIIFKVVKYGEHQWLCMRLPSGRKLWYFSPRWDADENQLRYMGIDTYTRQYTETSTYGGKLCENAVQAISRDLLVHAMLGCEDKGYKIIMTVHDEIVSEVPQGWGSVEEMRAIMRKLPAWAKGLPVDVAGGRMHRYSK